MPDHTLTSRQPTAVHVAPLDLTSVRDVQRALNLLHEKGFLHRESATAPLRQDGVIGKETHKQLVAFQQATYLHPTGQLDAATRGMLAQALASVGATADPGRDVPHLPQLPAPGGAAMPGAPGGAPTLNLTHLVDLQRALNLLGHNGMLPLPHPLPEDGRMAQPTHDAIVAFQQSNGFPATGLLDYDTRSSIGGWLHHLGIGSDPGPQGTIDPSAAQPPAAAPPPAAPTHAPPPGSPMVIASVQDVQHALNMLAQYGHVPLHQYLAVTGVVDHPTADALATFQLAFGLPPTRNIDVPTRSMLAQLLGQIGVSAYVPHAGAAQTPYASGALAEAPVASVDRLTQIRNLALSGLTELRNTGVNQVAESMRHIVSNPTVEALHNVVGGLSQPSAGAFANSVASLWKPPLDWYMQQPDPNAAFAPEVSAKIVPLLSQLDTVLSALGQLAATPTVDNLSATVSRLSQTPGGIASHMADTLRIVLAVVTAMPPSPPAANARV